MAPKYILHYFDGPGRGETIRLMFHAAGVEFTDNRIKGADWPSQKADARRFPLAQIPTLEVDDKVIIHSHAIGRYVARQLGFYGENAYDAAVVDQVCETLIDLANDAMEIIYGELDDETKKTKFAEYFSTDKLKLQLGYINNILKNSNGGFFLGEKSSYAEFLFYATQFKLLPFNSTFLDEYSELKALIKRVENIEGVKKYLNPKKE